MRRVLGAGSVLLAGGLVALSFRAAERPGPGGARPKEGDRLRPPALTTAEAPAPPAATAEEPAPPAPAPGVSAEARPELTVEGLMSNWRHAILVKNPDLVLELDGLFRSQPARFLPALMRSAQTDSEPRVRAFSTRVLGKIGAPESADLLRRLLDDESPYVRENAAWALGELAARPDGRTRARAAIADLQRIRSTDPSREVRGAAVATLEKL